MNATPESLNSLFSIDVQYKVPLYQRRYVWENSDWSELWKDILDQEKIDSFKNARHFTGPIVTRLIKRQQKRFEVIDGQQRLITFQIIFCVIRDLCELFEFSGSETEKKAKEHIENDETARKDFQSRDPNYEDPDKRLPDPTYKFIPTDYDKTAFDAIIEKLYGKKINETLKKNDNSPEEDILKEARSQQFGEETVSDNILNAYDYFYKKIKNYIEGDTQEDNHVEGVEEKLEKEKKISNLLDTIKSNFELVQITPGDSQQAEEIFESVNATGRKLSEFDYLRNNLFLRARDQSDEFYKEYWIFDNDPDSYDWNEDTLESFFQAFLMAKLGPNALNNNVKLFDLYQDNLVSEHNLAEEFEELRNHAEVYREMDDPTSEFGVRMQFYKDLSTFYTEEDEESYNPVKGLEYNYYVTVIRSFIMYLQQKLKRPKDEILSVFKILESYVARCLFADTVTNYDSYQSIKSFFSDLFSEQDDVFFSGDIIEYLKSKKSKREWISNTMIKSWFRGEKYLINWHGSLREDRQFSLRYIFYRIENWKRKHAGENMLSFEEFPPDKVSVRTFIQLTSDEEAWRSLGNLTFYWKDDHDQEINTLNSANAFLQEGRNNILLLNSEIYSEPESKWERGKIKGREQKLVSAFCNIWQPDPWEDIEDIKTEYPLLEEVEGTVVNIKEDGVYVQLELGIKGYVPVNEISWTRRKIIPSKHFEQGETVRAKVINEVVKEEREIRLSTRQTQPKPWKDFDAKYPVGKEVEGTVIEIDKSGITLELEEGVEGVIAKEEIAWTAHSNVDPNDYVNDGDQIKSKILKISKDQGILHLSIKQMQPNPWKDIDARYPVGKEVEGTVIEINKSGITLELEQGIGGVIAKEEIAWTAHSNVDPNDYVSKGDWIKAKIFEISKDQGILHLSIKQTQPNPWKDIDVRYPVGKEVEGTVIEINKSGITLELEQGIGGRVDASEIAWTLDKIIPSEHFKKDDTVIAKILKVSETKQEILLSIKQTQSNNPWKDIDTRYLVGEEVQGTVVEIDRYGTTFQLEPGVQGFINRDEMVWTNSSKNIVPSKIVNEGEEIKAKILEISAEKEYLQLSIKQTQPNPWIKFTQNNKEGTVVQGKIYEFTSFGAFAELEKGIVGLIRNSDLTDRWIEKPEEIVSKGEELDLKVIKIDQKKRQIYLSLKAVWAKIAEKYKVGSVVQGKIVKLSTCDALVELEEGIEVLIEKHELAGQLEKLSVGTELDVQVIKVDQYKRQIRLKEVTPTLLETRLKEAIEKKNTDKSEG